jgi:hypothetical protein
VSENATNQGLTRRELLKKGAILGGALAWAAPTVQIIGMQPAMAAHVSDRCICVKFDGSDDNGNYWTSIGNTGENQGTCIPAIPSNCENFSPDSTFQAGNCDGSSDTFCIEKDGDTWYLFFPLYCSLTELYTKCGSSCEALIEDGLIVDPEKVSITVAPSGEANMATIYPCSSLSHFEFCFTC